MKLDLYDKKIIYELDINSRVSASELGKKLKLAKESVNYRVKRLVRQDIITGFYTVFNSSYFGYSYFKTFFMFDKLPPEEEKNIIDYLSTSPNCAELKILEGQYDISIVSIHRGFSDFRQFIQRFQNNFGKYVLEKDIHTILKSHPINLKFLFEGASVKRSANLISEKPYSLDELDMRIIKLLAENARIQLTEIARRVGADSRRVRYRIKRMETRDIITAHRVGLNLQKINREGIQLDICVKDLTKIPQIVEFFDRTNASTSAQELLGKYDLSVELYVENDEELRKILEEFKKRFLESYLHYSLSHVYKEIIVNWSPFASD